MATLTIRIPDAQRDRLAAMAAQRGISVNKLEASGNLYPWDAYDDSLSSARGGVDGEAGGVLER